MADRPLVLAHRGASRAAPENTLEAFAQARKLGADGVELDVRRTADGVLVVNHDPHVAEFGLLIEQPFAALRASVPSVPTLAEALGACTGMLVNVEIKCLPWEPDPDAADHAVVHATADLVREAAPGSIISSFNLGSVDACRAYAPDITTAWLTSRHTIADAARQTSGCGHAWLNPDRLTALQTAPAVVAEVHRSGQKISVWTVDDPTEARQLAALGVDAIITNVPDVILGALVELA